ncbi:uncharacterized protein HMPREF1541_06626 [Cyphellophora europaea CBS 101466]|uniref:GPI transamidase component PIG-S n=1 Tax=Cyphellophora europaea (strain CBS 101466) TaxID=1220924 RepID=W2RS94_CYPE1|nr:uncharacterized protein HMPREF1541_06626 [Cyphellophora europaea CBS 101466]ETN38589.1 hypothetical protein HMPREF1541_06626 [Cyphellophora europaea CBS 101466]
MVAVEARKKAPPETPESIGLRSKIVLSFWAVILLLGLPTWYKTTEIYRASLPLEQMLGLSECEPPLPKLPPQIWLDIPGVLCADAQRIARDTQNELDLLGKESFTQPRVRLVHNEDDSGPKCGVSLQSIKEEGPDFEVRFAGEATQYTFELENGRSKALVKYSQSQRPALPRDLALSIRDVFADEEVAHLLQINKLVINHPYGLAFAQYNGDAVLEIEKQMGRAAKPSPGYHLTFSLFAATGAPSSWDIRKALDTHIQPLVHALEKTLAIEVGTQVQLFSPYSPSVETFQLQGTRGNFLHQGDLTSFVNAAEWPLSPSIGDGPTLNFIVYVPSKADLPLGIEGDLGGAWMVPQWGGISIVNPDLVEDPETGSYVLPPHLSENMLSEAFQTFSSQLLALLGVLSTNYRGTPLPIPLRLRSHQRLTAMSLHLKASSSLGSLARLAKHLSSIPIPKHVAQLVDDSMSNLTSSTTALNNGEWEEAIKYASIAYQDAEKAFFDKSMVGQVYFPDEHKVAVYLPLLGPIGVPLVVGLLREVKRAATLLRAKKS